jgi:hypothetical protein
MQTSAPEGAHKNMDMQKYSGSTFLKVDDLRASGPRRVAIADVREGKYGRPDMEFDDGSKIGVNATNAKALVNAYGRNSDSWLNKQVELAIGEVKYQGEPKACIIITPISRPTEKKDPPAPPSMDDEIPF